MVNLSLCWKQQFLLRYSSNPSFSQFDILFCSCINVLTHISTVNWPFCRTVRLQHRMAQEFYLVLFLSSKYEKLPQSAHLWKLYVCVMIVLGKALLNVTAASVIDSVEYPINCSKLLEPMESRPLKYCYFSVKRLYHECVW